GAGGKMRAANGRPYKGGAGGKMRAANGRPYKGVTVGRGIGGVSACITTVGAAIGRPNHYCRFMPAMGKCNLEMKDHICYDDLEKQRIGDAYGIAKTKTQPSERIRLQHT
ncbi:MAG: hypothetical protein IJB22_03225, partial [Clostridia bacterium]|nr:hypothetical protein [Clostridia bacterium]